MCDDANYNVSGLCAASWESVRRLFCQNFIDQLDVGASLCVYHRGQCVVDLAGGRRTMEPVAQPYTHDTLQIVYSTAKGIIATAVALCVQRRWLDYDEPVSTYWPEFAQNGKEKVRLKDILSHRAGLPVVDDPLTADDILDDPTAVINQLVRQKPYWEPNVGGHGYHALTFGYLLSELICRVDPVKHRSMGQFIEEELGQVLDGSEFILPARLPLQCATRVSASILPLPTAPNSPDDQAPSSELSMRAFTLNGLLSSLPLDAADKRLSRINIVSNARSLARMYAALLFTENLLTTETLTKAIENNTPASEPDQILDGMPTKFSQGGFMLDETVVTGFGKVFGHWGLGGSIAFASVDKQLVFAFVPNMLNLDISKRDVRVQRLLEGILALIK